MKKSRKAALVAALFVAAVNMNACAYGPPPDELESEVTKTNISVSETEENTDSTEQTEENIQDEI